MTLRIECLRGLNRAIAHTSRQTQGRKNSSKERVSDMKVLVDDNF